MRMYYGASSSSKTYCTNYDSLTDDKKATVSTYTSYDAAYNAAYNEAYTKALNAANAAKNSTSHNYSATEVTARNGYYLNPGNMTVGQSAAGDASLNLSLANVRTTGKKIVRQVQSHRAMQHCPARSMDCMRGVTSCIRTDIPEFYIQPDHWLPHSRQRMQTDRQG